MEQHDNEINLQGMDLADRSFSTLHGFYGSPCMQQHGTCTGYIWQIRASVLLHGFYGSPCMQQHDNEINLNHRVWIWQIGASVLLHGFYGSPCMQQHDNEINLNYRVWIWQIRASTTPRALSTTPLQGFLWLSLHATA